MSVHPGGDAPKCPSSPPGGWLPPTAEPESAEVVRPRDRAARLTELTLRHWKRLRRMQSQRMQAPSQAWLPVALAQASQSFRGRAGWAAATQKRELPRALSWTLVQAQAV